MRDPATITLANGTLEQDSGRPAERWALGIRPGDCAPHHNLAGLTAKWLLAELVERPDFDKAHPFGATDRDAATVRPGFEHQAEAYALELLQAAHGEGLVL